MSLFLFLRDAKAPRATRHEHRTLEAVCLFVNPARTIQTKLEAKSQTHPPSHNSQDFPFFFPASTRESSFSTCIIYSKRVCSCRMCVRACCFLLQKGFSCLRPSLFTGHCQLTQNRLTRVQSLLTRKPAPHSSPQPYR
jgi:hypothetical protein